MTFEADLLTLIKAVTPRVYPDFAPTSTPRPYVTYQQIGGDVINLIENVAPGKRNAVCQVSVWSNTRAEALQISRAIEDAMRASSAYISRPIGAAVCDYDAEIPVYSARQDFTCWHST